jgi:glycosyltransferase involved in cell wall biosynthesis
MRILQVVALVSPDGAFGGPLRVAVNQSIELLKRGHDVTLVAATRGFRETPTEIEGVPVRLFEARTVLPGAGFPGVASPGLAMWVRAHCAEFDVVHVHFGRDLMVLPTAMSARGGKVPYVLQTHGMVTASQHPLAGPVDAIWTRRLLRDAAAVLYLTELERGQLEDVARGPLRLVHLGNGVPDYPQARRGSDIPEVLFVARLHPRKQPLAFIEMAKALLDEGVAAQFTLVGPDEGEGAAVRRAVAGETRICWQGALAPVDIPRRMADASVYVLPSIQEPYPMTVLEAMAVGLPVVVGEDCGLAPLIRQAQCGVVARRRSRGDTAGFADAVRSLLADPVLAADKGGLARKAARNEFGMCAIGDRLSRLYDEIRRDG